MYQVNIKMKDGRSIVINPSEEFQPFSSPKKGRMNNVTALVLDSATRLNPKNSTIKKASITNLETGKYQLILKSNRHARNKK